MEVRWRPHLGVGSAEGCGRAGLRRLGGRVEAFRVIVQASGRGGGSGALMGSQEAAYRPPQWRTSRRIPSRAARSAKQRGRAGRDRPSCPKTVAAGTNEIRTARSTDLRWRPWARRASSRGNVPRRPTLVYVSIGTKSGTTRGLRTCERSENPQVDWWA
jgi:hypothetical protein